MSMGMIPEGGGDDVEYGQRLWKALESQALAGASAKPLEVYKGQPPHGKFLELTWTADVVLDDHKGLATIKRSYGGKGVSAEAVNADRGGDLVYSEKINQDWRPAPRISGEPSVRTDWSALSRAQANHPSAAPDRTGWSSTSSTNRSRSGNTPASRSSRRSKAESIAIAPPVAATTSSSRTSSCRRARGLGYSRKTLRRRVSNTLPVLSVPIGHEPDSRYEVH